MNINSLNKSSRLPFCRVATLLSVQIAAAQGTFQNLDFEAAGVPVVPSYTPIQVLTSVALPGWTAYVTTNQQSQIWYNGVSAGGAIVTLIDTHTYDWSNAVIGGNFTATLDAGYDPVTDTHAPVTIAQTSLVPVAAKSLRFSASGDVEGFLLLTLNGLNVPFYPLEAGPNFEVYGGDITTFAGSTAELRFTEVFTPSRLFPIAFLDNIQFSEQPIPEPSAVSLLALGVGVLKWQGRRRRRA
jgi:hypothetical protein